MSSDQPRSWTKNFCCLGSNDETEAPNATRLINLINHGLGDAAISLNYNGTAESVRQALIETYPKLGNTQFELMKTVGSSGRVRPLCRLSSNELVVSVAQLRTIRANTIFVRPFVNLLQVKYK